MNQLCKGKESTWCSLEEKAYFVFPQKYEIQNPKSLDILKEKIKPWTKICDLHCDSFFFFFLGFLVI